MCTTTLVQLACCTYLPCSCVARHTLLPPPIVLTHPQVEEFELPSPQRVCALVLLSYFFVTAGIAYDIINEPPAIGARQDPVTGTAHSSRGLVAEAASSKHQL